MSPNNSCCTQYPADHEDPSNLDNIMLWSCSLSITAIFAQVRSSFLPSLTMTLPTINLNYNNISVNNPANLSIVKVRLKCSKTDSFRHGVDDHVGKTGQLLCHVSALLNYLAMPKKRSKACYFTLKMDHC